MHRLRAVWTLAAGLVVVLALGAGTMTAQAHDWAIDNSNSHSEADFSGRHMGISTVHGSVPLTPRKRCEAVKNVATRSK